jgi:glycosyltransferase involved in cell wall biosynthesis
MRPVNNKIAIVSHCLGGGGAERFAATLSFILDDLGYEVHHIIINDLIDYEFKGQLLNLGQVQTHFIFRKIKKAFLLWQYLRQNKIDSVIDNRPRNFFLRDWISKIIFGKRRVFYIVHSFKLSQYLPDSVILARYLYQNAEKIIGVSKAIENKIMEKYNFKNTLTLYNPINFSSLQSDALLDLEGDFILYFGRIEENVKHFNLMLDAFSMSNLPQQGIPLLIMGDGPDVDAVKEVISKLNLATHVTLLSFQKNPFAYVQKAKFTILSSHYEGFPMSIIESLALGTPVVAVDCQSGPSEVIVNGHNGMLVENYNSNALAKAMNRMMEDQVLYTNCKRNAQQSVAHLSLENLAKQWKQILS